MTVPGPRHKQTCSTGFGPGTYVVTDRGEMPVEWLETGYKVLTLDSGFEAIIAVRRHQTSPEELRTLPYLWPLRVPAGAFGDGSPSEDLHLAPGQKVMVRSPLATARYGQAEVLAPAEAWADLGRAEPYLPNSPWTLTQVYCETASIVRVQGAWLELCSFASQQKQQFAEMPARPYVARSEAHGLIESSRDGLHARLPDTVRKRA